MFGQQRTAAAYESFWRSVFFVILGCVAAVVVVFAVPLLLGGLYLVVLVPYVLPWAIVGMGLLMLALVLKRRRG